ncbi:MAG: pyrroline-5-carboxylate reductase [Desulfovibrio sp.]
MTVRLGFIGTGNMGSAISIGLANEPLEIHGYDIHDEKLRELAESCGMKAASSPAELVRNCDYIILSVKPQYAEQVLQDVMSELNEDKCLLSIAAGITQQSLRDLTQDRCPVVRVMPNTPALVGEGVFAVCLDDARLSEKQIDFVSNVFKPVGQVYILQEKYFDAFTAVVGSGPAYVFYFMEAMMESAVTLGFSRQDATEMVKSLFAGSVKLTQESDEHISVLREMVTSPGGTTIQALNHLDRTATRANINDAVKASFDRSVFLGKK